MLSLALFLLPLIPASMVQRPSAVELRPRESSSTPLLTTGGLAWILNAGSTLPRFALGDRGGQVFALLGDARIRLYSSFDSTPPVEFWTSPPADAWVPVAAASESDVYLHNQMRIHGVMSSVGVLRLFRSRSNEAEWRYEFPEQFLSAPAFDLSRDGLTIVSVFARDATFRVEMRVHDPATGQPIQTHIPPALGYSSRCDLSPDGTVVAYSFHGGTGTTEVYEIGTWTHLGTLPGNLAGNQAVSDGGTVVATFEVTPSVGCHVRAHQRTPGGYQLVLDVATPVTVDPRDVVVSDNGATLAAGWGDSGSPRHAIVRAYDIATATMTMEHVDTGVALDILPGKLSIDAAGSRFAVGQNGNGSGSFPELAIYSPTSSTPLRTHPRGGAVFDVELSPDGKRYAASRSLGNRGFGQTYLELYEFGDEDLAVRGTPSLGATIDFELHAAPGSRAWLMRSFSLAPTPIVIPGVGTLRLDAGSLTMTPLGVVPGSGIASHSTIATTFPGMIGRTLWYQGFTTNPRTLSNDFVQLTIVP